MAEAALSSAAVSSGLRSHLFTHTRVGISKCDARRRTRSASLRPAGVGSETTNTASAPASDAMTADAWRAIHDQPSCPVALGKFRRAASHLGDQFAGVLLAHAQPRVDQRPVAGLGDEKLARDDGVEVHRLGGTHSGAKPAALASEGVEARKAMLDDQGIEGAILDARPTPGALLGVEPRLAVADEVLGLANLGVEQEMEVGRVHVAIGRHDLLRQGHERGGDSRLPGSSLSADDHQLLHRLACSRR